MRLGLIETRVCLEIGGTGRKQRGGKDCAKRKKLESRKRRRRKEEREDVC